MNKFIIAAVFISLSPIFAMAEMETEQPEDVNTLRKPRLSEIDLLSRIENIEQNMVALQKQVYSEPRGGSSANSAAVAAQFEELYTDLKSIRGEIEQLQFENTKLTEKFTKFAADVDLRLAELSQAKNQQANKATAEAKKLDHIDDQLSQQTLFMGSDEKALAEKIKDAQAGKKQPAPKGQATKMYEYAYGLMKEKKFSKALKAFSDFVNKNQGSPKVADAYFWMGEIEYQASEYKKAALNYLKGYQAAQKGKKAPDNLLKLSEALAKLYKSKEACLTLIKLKTEFPNADEAIKKRAKNLGTNLACKQ